MEGTLGEIRMFGGNFAPDNWALCNGQVLPIADNEALYTIVGDTYAGGNGQSTFALPDLRARSCMQFGEGPSGNDYKYGSSGGNEIMTLSVSNLPEHKHYISKKNISFYSVQGVYQGDGDSFTPNNAYPAIVDDNIYFASPGQYDDSAQAEVSVTSNMVTTSTGEGESFYIRSPYMVVNYIICIKGDFPSRN